MDSSSLYRLASKDFIKGAVTAIAGGALLAIGTVIHGVITADTFNVFMIDWTPIVHNLVNASVVGAEGGFSGYLLKNFLSDENGAVLGKFGGAR